MSCWVQSVPTRGLNPRRREIRTTCYGYGLKGIAYVDCFVRQYLFLPPVPFFFPVMHSSSNNIFIVFTSGECLLKL
ncbi:unnamed protein product [Musa acuminata subsp. malaccensis]|uniref:(wild Malaysian banana) hypothetical protein n=1 Tax=Musa acuminata subsp. malaccensis TaxID=214687 RepID=A0A804IQ40_MUSAM|nr:unnamed protein product [Musa acuminata subsp. malaccensis]